MFDSLSLRTSSRRKSSWVACQDKNKAPASFVYHVPTARSAFWRKSGGRMVSSSKASMSAGRAVVTQRLRNASARWGASSRRSSSRDFLLCKNHCAKNPAAKPMAGKSTYLTIAASTFMSSSLIECPLTASGCERLSAPNKLTWTGLNAIFSSTAIAPLPARTDDKNGRYGV